MGTNSFLAEVANVVITKASAAGVPGSIYVSKKKRWDNILEVDGMKCWKVEDLRDIHVFICPNFSFVSSRVYGINVVGNASPRA